MQIFLLRLFQFLTANVTSPITELEKLCRQSLQFNSVAQSCLTVCDPMDCSTPGFPVHHQLLELTQTHVHWVGDAIHPSHPLSSPFSPAPNPSQHQSLFHWVSSSHQVAKVLEFELQHHFFQWIFNSSMLSFHYSPTLTSIMTSGKTIAWLYRLLSAK